ncbi:hypothetical protein D3C79_554090 [compost metagenome]
MAILGINQHKGVRRYLFACIDQGDTGSVAASCPQVHGRCFIAGSYHGLGHIELAIELQRAGLNSHGARSFAWTTALVDDPCANTLPGEPKR